MHRRLAGMTAGWFALGGVVIGGLLNGFVSWLLGRSTLRANARVAALLVTEELMQSMPAMLQLGKQHTWGALNLAHDFGKREAWEQNRATLGHALHPDGYMTLAAAYSGLAGAAERAAREPSTGNPSEEEGMSIATTYLTMNRGLSYLGLLVHQLSRFKPCARRKFRRDSQAHIDDLLRRDALSGLHGRARKAGVVR